MIDCCRLNSQSVLIKSSFEPHNIHIMNLPASIKRCLALLGYQNQWPYGHLYNRFRRTSCILLTTLIILPTFYKCAFETGTVSDQIRALLGFMCGFSSLAYFSIMLLNRRSILDVFAKLQLKVNERTVRHWHPILFFCQFRRPNCFFGPLGELTFNCYFYKIIFSGEARSNVTIYRKASRQFEGMAKRVSFFIFVVIVPLFNLPTMFYSYIMYYMHDASESSFRLALDIA